MKENKDITLQIPSSVYSDEYYKVVIDVFGEMLTELKDNVRVPIDYIKIEDKETLLNLAKSSGVETIFKRLPIQRGRQLLNEFPYLIRGKGSSEAIERMAQIYLGVVYSKVVDYDRSDKSYSLDLVYGEVAGLDSFYLKTLYDAIKYVNPIGRFMKGYTTNVEPIASPAIQSVETEVYVKSRSLLGYNTKSLKSLKVKDVYNFTIRPNFNINKDILNIFGGIV